MVTCRAVPTEHTELVFQESRSCTGVDVGSNARASCATACVDITGFALVLTGSKAEQTFPGAVNSPLAGCWHLGWTGLCRDVTHPGGYTGPFSRRVEGRGCEGSQEFPMATQTRHCCACEEQALGQGEDTRLLKLQANQTPQELGPTGTGIPYVAV